MLQMYYVTFRGLVYSAHAGNHKIKTVQHCLWEWLVTFSVPSHCRNQMFNCQQRHYKTYYKFQLV